MAVASSRSSRGKTASPQPESGSPPRKDLPSPTLGQRVAGMLPTSNLPDVARTLTEQKFTIFKTAFDSITPDSAKDKGVGETYKKVKAILDSPPEQREPDAVNEVEQGLVLLQEAEALRIELLRMLDGARRLNLKNVTFYEGRITQEQLDKPDNIDKKEKSIRELMVRLTGDLQHFNTQRQLQRIHARTAAKRVAYLFLAAMALFVLLLLITDPKEQGAEPATTPAKTSAIGGTAKSGKKPGE